MHNVDLTEGSPWKKVLLFTIPLLLATILTDLYSLVDNLVLGKFVAEYYSGAASASPVINLFGMFMVGLGVGFSSFTSKYIGEKNEEETHRSSVRSIVLVVIIEFILYTTALLLIDPLLSLVNISKEADATLYEGAFYKMLIVLSTGFIGLVNAAIISQLRAVGDGVSPLLFTAASNIANILFDLLMAFVMPTRRLKLIGILLATTFSTIIEFCFIIIYIRKKYPLFKIGLKEIPSCLDDSWNYVKTALPVALQWSMIFIGFIAVQAAYVQFDLIASQQAGTIIHDAVNGKTSASTLASYLCSVFMSFGTAIMAFTAQNYGAKKYERIRNATKQFLIVTLIIYGALNLFTFFIVFKGSGLYLFLDKDYINKNSIWYFSTYYLIISSTVVINGILIVYRNVLQGLLKTIYPLIASVGELIARVAIANILKTTFSNGTLSYNQAYILASFTDPLAWFLCVVVLVVAGYIHIHSKKSKHSIYQMIEQKESH